MFYEVLMEKKARKEEEKPRLSTGQKIGVGAAGLLGVPFGMQAAISPMNHSEAYRDYMINAKGLKNLATNTDTYSNIDDAMADLGKALDVGKRRRNVAMGIGGALGAGIAGFGAKKFFDQRNQRKSQEKTAMDFGVRYNIQPARKSTKSTMRELQALRDDKFPGRPAFDDTVEDAYVDKAKKRARILGAGAGLLAGGALGYGLKRGINSAKNAREVSKAFKKNFGNFDPAKDVIPTLIDERKGAIPYAIGGGLLGGAFGGYALNELTDNETRVDIDRARDAHMRALRTHAAIQGR
jgi:hypothetical protein